MGSWFGLIGTLIIMEGLLSADNALVLAAMVRNIKDPNQRKKALFYGMWGAIGFRAICILLGVWLIKLWWIKVLGAMYLLKLVVDHFKGSDEKDENNDGIADKFQETLLHKLLGKVGIKLSVFWSVVISVEIMDIAFSVDSILASLAISDKFIILFIGGILGIVMMRGVAGVFLKLIEKIPELEHTAFVLIAIIAIKMLLTTVGKIGESLKQLSHLLVKFGDYEVADGIFFSILGGTFLITYIIHLINNRKKKSVVKEA